MSGSRPGIGVFSGGCSYKPLSRLHSQVLESMAAISDEKNPKSNIYKNLTFYLMTHSTHFIYSYMTSGIW